MQNPAKSPKHSFYIIAAYILCVCFFTNLSAIATDKNKKDEKKDEVIELSMFSVTSFGATPGGFKDINYGRQLLEWGMLPYEGEFTAEGLFSEFDLPTPTAGKSKNLLDVTGDAKPSVILNKPEVTHLAQIGFASGLDPRTWKRDPLLIVVVADVSGSMQGNLGLLKDTIQIILSKLGPDDAMALVSFSSDVKLEFGASHVRSGQREKMSMDINALKIRSATNIEAGLKMGFDSALNDLPDFKGRRRVILITDAMPNVQSTTPENFMTIAETASLKGAGLTTIGVGMVFDADFVKRVSSVSGGNAYYFPDAAEMKKRMDDDFDFMVTELAYDMHIQVNPEPGYRVVDVYGLPGNMYARTPEGGMAMDLATVFLSREKGGIFVSLASNIAGAGADASEKIGNVTLSYVLRGESTPKTSAFDLIANKNKKPGTGLLRGEFLVNEYEALRAASIAFYNDGNLTAARDMVKALSDIAARTRDSALKKEIRLLDNLQLFLDVAVEMSPLDSSSLRANPEKSPLLGIWKNNDENTYVAFLPSGRVIEVAQEKRRFNESRVTQWKGDKLTNKAGGIRGTLKIERGTLHIYNKDENDETLLTRCSVTEIWKKQSK